MDHEACALVRRIALMNGLSGFWTGERGDSNASVERQPARSRRAQGQANPKLRVGTVAETDRRMVKTIHQNDFH